MTSDAPETPGPPPSQPPPTTGVSTVDEATAALHDLPDAPLAEHADRLAAAHAVLDQALHPDQPG